MEESAKPKTGHHRFGRNIISNWMGYAVSLGIGFLVAPLLVHRLGDTGYGIWSLSLQFGAYIAVLDFGVRIALTRYLTHYHAKGDMDQVHGAFSVGVTILAAIGIFSLIVTLILVHFLPKLITIPVELQTVARWTLLLIGLQVSISFPGAIFGGMLAALSRYDLLNITTIVTSIAKALLFWFVLARGYGLLSVAIVMLLAACATHVWQFVLAWRLYGGFQYRIGRELVDKTLKPLLTFSFFAFLLSLSGRLVLWTDGIVVGMVLGPALVTFYAIGGNLVDCLQGLVSSSVMLLVPLATSYDALSEEEKLRSLFSRSSRFLLLLILPVMVGMLVLGSTFITLWMGQRYVDISAKVLILLTVPMLFAPMRSTAHQVLYGTNRHKFNAYASLIEGLANLALSIVLAYRIGVIGVAWGTLIPSVLTAGIVIPCYTARKLKMNYQALYWNSLLLPLFAGLPYVALLSVLRATGAASGWIGFFGSVLGSLPLYYLFIWTVVLQKPEKEMVRHQLRLTLRQASS